MTLLFIGVSVGAAFYAYVQPDVILMNGFVPDHPSLADALTSIFLHENIIHLLGNMIFLAAVGPLAEQALRPFKFGLLYLLSGLAGVGGHYLLIPATMTFQPLVGASGAVAGAIAYVSVRYWRLKVPIAPSFGVPVWLLASFWVILQIVGGFVQVVDEVAAAAYWSHLAGFLFGLLFSVIFRAPKAAQLELGYEVLERMNERGPAASLRAAESHLESHPKDRKAWQQRIEALRHLGERDKEAEALRDYMPQAGDGELPMMVDRLSALGGLDAIPAGERARMAASYPSVAEPLLTSVIQDRDAPERPDALLQLAELLSDRDDSRANELLQELKEHHSLHPAADLARAKGLIT